MLVATGTLLVLLTWGFLLALVIALGLLPAALTNANASRTQLVRHALWWGIALASIIIAALSLVVPLGGPTVGITLVLVAALLGTAGFRTARHRGWRTPRAAMAHPKLWWIVLAALAMAQVTFAIAALGPVTNYDTGLYHLGAIAYGRDFAAIPGLANLYGPLGYATLEFPWAAALSGPPWGVDGFRLVNGFLIAAVALDLALRLRGPRTVGTYVLLVGIVVTWGPMLGMADFWITSPTQDASALVLSMIVAAYFSDAIAGLRNWIADAAVAIIAGITLVAVRTTMVVFLLATLAVAIGLVTRRKPPRKRLSRSALLIGITALATAFVLAARDYLLSGWLAYPLSFFAFDVPWRAADPTPLRDATLGFHRNPVDAEAALGNWFWIVDWFTRVSRSWEVLALIAMAVLLVIIAILVRVSQRRIPWRSIAIATMPSALAVVVWFVASPPAFRFIWGPLFLTLAIPLGWLLMRLPRSATNILTLVAATGLLVGAAVTTLAIRIDWSSMTADRQWEGIVPVPYVVTPIQDAPTTANELPSGLVIDVPTQTDQCWGNYPLCSPAAPPTLTLRGDDLSEGFTR